MTATAMKRPAAPAIKQTKLLIDGQFVDPVDGKSFETLNPRPRRDRGLPANSPAIAGR